VPIPVDLSAVTLAEVADFVPTRTIDATGSETGTFTTTTTPTDVQVLRLVDKVAADVDAAVGTVDVTLGNAYRSAVALGTAGYVEQTYPASTDSLNVADRLFARYDKAVKALALAQKQIDTSGAAGVTAETVPVYSFPDAGAEITL
jgi:hypothetical protein